MKIYYTCPYYFKPVNHTTVAKQNIVLNHTSIPLKQVSNQMTRFKPNENFTMKHEDSDMSQTRLDFCKTRLDVRIGQSLT